MTETLPEMFWQGVREFNQAEYYTCHDTLEALWITASEPPKSLYQGILQIAVACYHLGNQNWLGAVTLLGEGIRRLRAYEPTYAQLDVTRLTTDAEQLLSALQSAGAEQVHLFVSPQESAGMRLVLNTVEPESGSEPGKEEHREI